MDKNRLICGALRVLNANVQCNKALPSFRWECQRAFGCYTRVSFRPSCLLLPCDFTKPMSIYNSASPCSISQLQNVGFATRASGSGHGASNPTSHLPPQQQERERRNRLGRLVMSRELQERKMRLIEAQKEEQVPEKFFAKFHYYFKRYWYIAIPVHIVVCGCWFAGLYFAVKCGMDVVALLEFFHLPDHWVQKVREVPPSAGYAVAALILYKLVTPLRYACTLVGIRLAYNMLRHKGKLRTTRELDLAVRQRTDRMIERRLQRQRKRQNGNGNGKNGKSSSNGNGKNGKSSSSSSASRSSSKNGGPKPD